MKLEENTQADTQHCTHICLKFKQLVQTEDRYSNKTCKEIVFIKKGNENICVCLWAPHFLWRGDGPSRVYMDISLAGRARCGSTNKVAFDDELPAPWHPLHATQEANITGLGSFACITQLVT